ncbi:ubiquitin-like domain-containing protein [Nocardiopsis sp. LSu2-4]|uniref:Ubiquitin-like domain-containing protein n=1 Tax=Nocardiopsis suaedae TaxID=3018444 RepID=A0ABT4TNK0_9ACTN|nr:resuscitation-promoting factor [Nocardiopsis suaedae]MDA2805955.1 ubiquitin-like domain-containing protein [Nocardiopsis suaedae]
MGAGAAALLLAGGGTAYAMDKQVLLDVDGRERVVHTYAATVGEVLDAAGVRLKENDAVAPGLGEEVGRGGAVVVRSARELTVAIDGEEPEAHRVTALTVGEALDQIGLSAEPLELSEERSAPIPEEGLEVTGERARGMVILRDRVRTEVATTEAVVGDVLAENGIDVGAHDIVEPEVDRPAEEGAVIRVVEALGEPETEEVAIEAETEERETDELEKGEERTVREAEDGVKEVTVLPVLEEGEEAERVLEEQVVEEPVDGVVEVGTAEPGQAGSAGGLNWSALAQCESGGDPSAVNAAGGYYGLYQFSPSTWRSAGGTGSPAEASASEQTMRAQKLYEMVGGNWRSQWPECGRHLFD